MESAFTTLESGKVAIRPGKYYLGDPCWAFENDDETWQALLGNSDFEKGPIARANGVEMIAFRTEHGDFPVECDEGLILVESGLIGLVPASVSPEAPECMFEVEAEEGDTCFMADGVIWIGEIRIDTNREPEDRNDPEEDGAEGPRF